VRKRINGIRVVFDRVSGQHAQSVQLMAESLFANDELGCIRPIEAVDAVRPCYSILHFWGIGLVVSVLEEPRLLQYVVGDLFENSYHVLSAPVDVSPNAVWGTNVFAARLMSKALYIIFLSSGSDWFR
jgi:hypothetical protein